jgi:micrococcal nuclease
VPSPNWIYNAEVKRVVDGDTVDVLVDVGFGVTMGTTRKPLRLRLIGIDAPETRTRDLDEKKAGLNTKAWLHEKVAGKSIVIKTSKGSGKYGRWLAEIFLPGEEISLNQQMLDLGLADEYPS